MADVCRMVLSLLLATEVDIDLAGGLGRLGRSVGWLHLDSRVAADGVACNEGSPKDSQTNAPKPFQNM